MEKRKLIHFGRSAFCITLPSAWVKKNRMKKGDEVFVNETTRSSLEVSSVPKLIKENYELVIEIADKQEDEILELILASYLNGYTTIKLIGPNSGKIEKITKQVKELIATEVMEANTNSITINVFWDLNDIDLDSIINRIGHILRTIFTEIIEMLDSRAKVTEIIDKGNEVQRQILLCRRAIKCALNNSALAKKFNLMPLEMFYLSNIKYSLGVISEHLIGIARIIYEDKLDKSLSPKDKKELREILQKVMHYFTNVLDHFIKSKNQERISLKDFADFEKKMSKFMNSPETSMPLLAEYITLILVKIKEIQFNVIGMQNCPK